MRIAAFARSLSRRPTGRGMVAREILAALPRVREGIELTVFAAEPVPELPVRTLPACGRTPFSSAWRLFRGIGRDLKSLRPDVLWCSTHLVPAGLDPALPVVSTALDVVWRDRPDTMSARHRWVSRWAEAGFHRASRIACISGFTRDRLAAHWPDLRMRAGVAALAANPRLRRPADPAAVVRDCFGLEGPFLLSVGTIEPRKGLDVVVEAMALRPEWRLVHCGPGGWKSTSTMARMDASGRVRRLGWQDEATLAALYGAATACVSASVYEGFDLPPVDALSMGCPVLASDIPVHREVLGDQAKYFPPGDAHALAGLFPEPGTRIQAPAPPTRTWEDTARAVLKLLDQAVAS